MNDVALLQAVVWSLLCDLAWMAPLIAVIVGVVAAVVHGADRAWDRRYRPQRLGPWGPIDRDWYRR